MNDKLLKLLLILLVCIPMASTDIFIPALPSMVTELNTNISTIGLVLSAYMVGFSISMLTSGTFSDLYGRRIVLIYTISIYVVASLCIVFCNNIYMLIILRFFQGLGGGSGTVVGRLILKDYYHEKEQVNMMSTLSTGMAIAPAIAPQIGAICTKFFTWQACFMVTFLVGCFILWVLVFKFIETNTTKSKLNPIMQLPMSLFTAFNTKQFFGFTLLISFAWCAYFNFIGASSFLFQKIYLYSENQYAFVIGIVTVGYLLGTTATRMLNKRNFSIERIIAIGVMICLIGGVMFVASFVLGFSIALIISMFVVRLGIGLIMPTSQVGAMKFHKNNTGWYMGCLFFIEFILGSTTLYMAGFLENMRIGFGMTSTICLSVLLLIVGLVLIREKQSH